METKSKLALKIAFISQFIAVCVHSYLAITHYQTKFGLSQGKTLCNISDFINCDVANSSSYAVLFGSPLAVWGLLTNLCLLIVLTIYWLSDDKEFYRHFSKALSLLTLSASVVMAFITVTKVNAVCLFCLSAYILSIITFVALHKIKPETKAISVGEFVKLFFTATYFKVGFTLLAAVPLISLLINSMVMNSYANGAEHAIAASLTEWKNGSDVDLSSAKGLTKGADPAQAKMVIVEFADFQCIHCKQAHPVLASFVRSRPDVTMIFQSFPLDGVCNPSIPRQGDGKSCDLAKAVYCGWKLGKGWELHDWIFENFGADLNELTSYALSIGLNMDEFRKCRDLPETAQAIIDQANLGNKAGVKGTPSVFVNGRLLPGGQVMMILDAAYNEIKKSN